MITIKIVPRSDPTTHRFEDHEQYRLAKKLSGKIFQVEWMSFSFKVANSDLLLSPMDCVEIIPVTLANIKFCLDVVDKMFGVPAAMPTYAHMKAVIDNVPGYLDMRLYDHDTVCTVFGIGSVMVWVYTFIRDNRSAFTKEVQHD